VLTDVMIRVIADGGGTARLADRVPAEVALAGAAAAVSGSAAGASALDGISGWE
jgi:hypothetical protein